MCCISGNPGFRPAFLILTLALTACTKHYRAEGVVLKIDPPRQAVTISHRAIPHYMEGMVMPFTASDPRELTDLSPGARITFQLDVSREKTRISRIRRESIGIDDVPAPPPVNRLAVGDPVPAFTLMDQNNQIIHLSDFLGRPIVLDFIYTRCPLPDVCPRLSANLARLQKRFGPRLPLLSITLDPQFDTPEVLAAYAHRWRADPANWHFLTGPEDRIRALASNFGLVYWNEEGLVTHTAVTALIDSQGKLAALLEGSRFTSQQLLDLASTALELRAQPSLPDPPNAPVP